MLRDATVLITGASAGIGAACAEAFAEAGARPILAARRKSKLDELAAQLAAEVQVLDLDVREPAAVEAAIAGLTPAWQAIDVLVNNAGLSRGLGPVWEHTDEQVDTMLDTNVKGLLWVTRAVVPGMLERGRGHVINIGSTAGHGVYAGGVVYSATKHAVGAITQGLKIDLHGTPIRVSTVDPGLTETDFSLVRFDGDAERADSVYATTRPLQPEDVAEAVVWCAARPAHVNIAEVIMMSTAQSSTTLIQRDEA
ncbi:MAG: SDR family NAD(P)-dependent oxidoreductase [Rhodothermaceae bacterium]|nr:SDR family NAD(P)-dependent oxidoreductase [Rhodothermaceae bacterium]